MKYTTDALSALRLFKEECTQFDALITDPPYDTGQMGNGKVRKLFPTMNVRDCLQIVLDYRDVLKPGADVYVFGNWRAAVEGVGFLESAGWPVRSFIPWWKREVGVGHYWRNCCEYILHLTNGTKPRGRQEDRKVYYPPAILRIEGANARRMDAYTKPWEIYLQLLRPTIRRGDRVVDPFAGSCPLERAAAMLGATAYCVDVDSSWTARP